MNIDNISGKINAGSPWLKPLNAEVLGGLFGMMSQTSDGRTTILTPRKLPWQQRTEYSYIWVPPRSVA